ncbi:hypothetical protein [Tateyamaria sp. Alg231-49]|uniref:hypothetical protein n=1 Tax=Tateyamaria sp. Alg231-49 TaxID=1922219 RepID=UPI00131F038A|nr:hypothetical protein [Tateyamaria sp. Alg231-49]
MTETRALRCDGAKAHAALLLLQSAKYPTDMTSKVIMGPISVTYSQRYGVTGAFGL